jgi:hypothetical protein
MATTNKPANTLRCGNIKATIWQNSPACRGRGQGPEGSVLLHDFFPPVQGSIRRLAQRDLVWSP